MQLPEINIELCQQEAATAALMRHHLNTMAGLELAFHKCAAVSEALSLVGCPQDYRPAHRYGKGKRAESVPG
jgi:hypothetical protein